MRNTAPHEKRRRLPFPLLFLFAISEVIINEEFSTKFSKSPKERSGQSWSTAKRRLKTSTPPNKFSTRLVFCNDFTKGPQFIKNEVESVFKKFPIDSFLRAIKCPHTALYPSTGSQSTLEPDLTGLESQFSRNLGWIERLAENPEFHRILVSAHLCNPLNR